MGACLEYRGGAQKHILVQEELILLAKCIFHSDITYKNEGSTKPRKILVSWLLDGSARSDISPILPTSVR
jgi:hypothetical protein